LTKLATLYTKIAKLAEIVRIQDSTILSLCNTAMNTLSVDDIQILQIGAVEVIGTVSFSSNIIITMLMPVQ
jgi:hypothetical protein